MAMIAPILGIAGAAIGAMGSIYQGQAAANAANYNAQVQEQLAAQRRQEGAAAAETKTHELRRNLGLQRAAIGESGFGYSGSLLDIAKQSEANQTLDVMTLAYEGEAAARGHMNNAARYRLEAETAQAGGYIGGVSRLLSGFANPGGYGRGGTALWV